MTNQESYEQILYLKSQVGQKLIGITSGLHKDGFKVSLHFPDFVLELPIHGFHVSCILERIPASIADVKKFNKKGK